MTSLTEKLNKINAVSWYGRTMLSFILILISTSLNVSGQNSGVVAPHYLLPEFTMGKVLLQGGVIRDLKMNYNLITEEMIFEYPGKYLALTGIETVDTVFIQDRKFVPSGKIFHELLFKGSTPLFAKHTCTVTPPGKPSGYGGTSQTSSIMVVDQLFTKRGRAYEMELPADYTVTPNTDYLLLKNGDFIRIYNIKQVIKAFPEKASQIKDYNKKRKTDFKNQNDVVSLIKFCNN